jgi:L-ascorbate metabolism protein UlaG (beta-lactamase superfamily)
MKFKWFNTASWAITTGSGVRIITDPYFAAYVPEGPPPPGSQDRPTVGEPADIVMITHPHYDHSYAYDVKGVFQLYTGGQPAEIKGVKFSSVNAWHDNYGDGGRGMVSVIGFEVDGLRIRHMGDYGQERLTDEQLSQIGRVDILLTPWGNWTKALVDQLKPKVIFPMHHAHADDYMRSLNYSKLTVSEVEYTAKTLPSEMKCFMLTPSRPFPGEE